jgi:hypothetical protein
LPDISEQLRLLMRWAEDLGNHTEIVTVLDPSKQEVAAVRVDHGPFGFVAVDQRGTLALLALIGIDPGMRSVLGGLEPATQQRMMVLLRNALLSNPRIGWTLLPPASTTIGDVESIQLVELFRLVDTPECFNRLADAIQELASLSAHTQQIYGALVPGPGMPAPSGAVQLSSSKGGGHPGYG